MVNVYTPRPAERQQSKLRMALAGPSGSGKTFTGLLCAGALGGQLCVIDAERGSSQKFLGEPDIPAFDIITLEEFTPEDFIAAITAAGTYDTLLVDSISVEWTSTLEIVDEVTLSSTSHNSFTTGWHVATPRHNKFVHALLNFPGHVIVTIRQKTKYVLSDNGRGSQIPKKVGWKLVQRPFLECEFDLMGELDDEHTLTITKSRCPSMDRKVIRCPTGDFMAPIHAWLGTGRKVYSLPELFAAVSAAGYGEIDLRSAMARFTPDIKNFRDLKSYQVEILYDYFRDGTATGTEG